MPKRNRLSKAGTTDVLPGSRTPPEWAWWGTRPPSGVAGSRVRPACCPKSAGSGAAVVSRVSQIQSGEGWQLPFQLTDEEMQHRGANIPKPSRAEVHFPPHSTEPYAFAVIHLAPNCSYFKEEPPPLIASYPL